MYIFEATIFRRYQKKFRREISYIHSKLNGPFGDYGVPLATGLGFSRPKPVFPVQNGINLFFPVFPVQNWEKLSKTGKNYAALFFKPHKVPQNVMYQIKV